AHALLLPDLIHRGLEHHLALIDENDLVQNLFHIGDQVGGDNHCRLGIVIADDGGEDVVPGGGVHAADGLIQQIQLCRPAHH
ncbi:Immunity protein 17, partial [Dysosmobacter welbionis]